MSVVLHKGEDCRFVPPPSAEPLRPASGGHGTHTVIFNRPPAVIGRMSVVGDKEGKGPLGAYFHRVEQDAKMGEKCFERAEIRMLECAIEGAVARSGKGIRDVDMLVSGDLLNQMTSSSYVARSLNMPHIGIYSACSTMTEALALGACFVDAGYFDTVACATVSHFATAERQYRYPLEYGCQRPPYAQWTVTGAACTLLSSESAERGVRVTSATFGKVVDFGVNDLNNMGAAMAPAAMHSLMTLFKDTNTRPEDYDLILTGDLGKLGSDILRELMREQGYTFGNNYSDCGAMIYDVNQHCYQGGSGAGCSSAVVNSFVIDKMLAGVYRRVAYFATGALMSPQSCYQGETIPCISHGIVLEA